MSLDSGGNTGANPVHLLTCKRVGRAGLDSGCVTYESVGIPQPLLTRWAGPFPERLRLACVARPSVLPPRN